MTPSLLRKIVNEQKKIGKPDYRDEKKYNFREEQVAYSTPCNARFKDLSPPSTYLLSDIYVSVNAINL